MVPDLRPLSPLSTGPTLFLAPSPTAWQARHLLNEVLPAATSCASAADDAAADAMTISVLRVSCFMECSWVRCRVFRDLFVAWAGRDGQAGWVPPLSIWRPTQTHRD